MNFLIQSSPVHLKKLKTFTLVLRMWLVDRSFTGHFCQIDWFLFCKTEDCRLLALFGNFVEMITVVMLKCAVEVDGIMFGKILRSLRSLAVVAGWKNPNDHAVTDKKLNAKKNKNKIFGNYHKICIECLIEERAFIINGGALILTFTVLHKTCTFYPIEIFIHCSLLFVLFKGLQQGKKQSAYSNPFVNRWSMLDLTLVWMQK
mgnify:CR=1 FL=1